MAGVSERGPEKRYVVSDPDGRSVYFEPTPDALRWKNGSLRLLRPESPLVVAAKDLTFTDPLGEFEGRVQYFGLRLPTEELGILIGRTQRLMVTIGVVRQTKHVLEDTVDFRYMIENRARGSREARRGI